MLCLRFSVPRRNVKKLLKHYIDISRQQCSILFDRKLISIFVKLMNVQVHLHVVRTHLCIQLPCTKLDLGIQLEGIG